jgi:hypothetical protein
MKAIQEEGNKKIAELQKKHDESQAAARKELEAGYKKLATLKAEVAAARKK